MALTSTTQWEVETGGGDTQGGAFDPGGTANFDAALACANGTTSAPCVNSANDTAAVGDIGNKLFIASGTNFYAGWYPITAIGAFSATITAGGTGYTVGDILTVSGGTSTAAASFKVATVTAGVVATLTATSTYCVPGAYSVLPSNPVSTTGGTGSACTLTITWGWVLNATAGVPTTLTYTQATTTGCGSSAALSSGTWAIDFSQVGTTTALTLLTTSGASSLNVIGTGFRKSWVGNGLCSTGGTNVNINTFVVSSVTSSTALTLIGSGTFSNGTGAASAGTANLGGAKVSLNGASSVAVSQNQIWMKKGSYSQSANPTMNFGSVTPGSASYANSITGYFTYRGDSPTIASGNQPVITASTGCTTIIPLGAITGYWIQNLTLDCATTVANSCVTTTGTSQIFCNCLFKNYKVSGVTIEGATCVYYCEFTGGTSAATAAINAITSTTLDYIVGNNIHDNQCTGITGVSGMFITDNLIVNNTGATSDGISMTIVSPIVGNTIYACGRDGIRLGTTTALDYTFIVTGNIIDSCGNSGGTNAATAYGLNFSVGALKNANQKWWDGNYYRNNLTANRNNCGTGVLDVSLSGIPFVNAGSNNFNLNTTAGAGAACTGTAQPTNFYFSNTSTTDTNYNSGGALQPTPAAGGSGTRRVPA